MTLRRHPWLATAGPDGPQTGISNGITHHRYQSPLLRPPTPADGAALHQLIRHCQPLDLNSCYAYLLQGLHFADTCVVASDEDGLAAYISGYIPPAQPDTLFIWQVAVAMQARGQGLALRMLQHVLARPACRSVRWLETTVSPDNQASSRLFQRLAARLDCRCEVSELFPASAFGAGSTHAAEPLYRIGPFTPTTTNAPEGHHVHHHL